MRNFWCSSLIVISIFSLIAGQDHSPVLFSLRQLAAFAVEACIAFVARIGTFAAAQPLGYIRLGQIQPVALRGSPRDLAQEPESRSLCMDPS